MRICMLTSGHDPLDNRIYYKELLSLRKIYSEIFIVAPGDEDFITDEGIQIKTFRKRKVWYDRIRPMNEMYKIALEVDADIYHAHEPDSFKVALKLKDKLNTKAIYDSHEYHPEAFAEHFSIGKNIIEKLIFLFEKKIAKEADYIITVNNILVDKFKEYNNNVSLIPNYPVLVGENFEKEYQDKPVFIYVGGLREDRGIIHILDSLSLVKGEYKFIFIGPYETEDLEKKINEMLSTELKGKDILFTGKIPHKAVFEYLKIADAGFVLLQPDNWRYVNSEPIKLFEYMMTKTAVIASDFPMMSKIIKVSKSGMVVKPNDINLIAKAIDEVGYNREKTKNMGECGSESVRKEYNWSKIEKRILKVYEDLETQ